VEREQKRKREEEEEEEEVVVVVGTLPRPSMWWASSSTELLAGRLRTWSARESPEDKEIGKGGHWRFQVQQLGGHCMHRSIQFGL
jgi:hypothetical protein